MQESRRDFLKTAGKTAAVVGAAMSGLPREASAKHSDEKFWKEVQKAFMIDKDLHYHNIGGTGAMPKHVVEKYGDDWVKPGRYVSNGPFKLVAWRLGDRITVEKNPYFYDAANVCLDRINFYPTPDVVSAERPGAGFEAVSPDLQDLYFHTLRQPAA